MARIMPAERALDEAVRLLRAGDIVAIPTETVYGLAADATDGAAVARIFEAKRRPRFNPLIAHIADFSMAERIARFDKMSQRLATAFWPGPLTLVLEKIHGGGVHELVTAGLDTIAVRMPRGIARDIAAALERPLAAPSANLSGRISATTAQSVAKGLGEKIPLIIDGGAARVGIESTICKVSGDHVTILRHGGLTADEIEQIAGMPVLEGAKDDKIEGPGMLASHYAPNARMRLNANEAYPGEALLAFGPNRAKGAETVAAIRNLSESGDLREAAANLFAYMNDLDAVGAPVIAAEPVPAYGLGAAINDRLMRAAAPRGEERGR